MNRLVKGLLASAAATGMAYLIWSRVQADRIRLVPPVKEVELDSLPDDLRNELLAELDEQLQ